MPSRSTARWLLRKEWRLLRTSRSWWLLLLVMGPLVGVSFISAVRAYGELSGLNGTAAGVGEAFSPLIGIWGPTFSACEIAAAFLLPFVAIRLVTGDRQSGALILELQQPFPSMGRIAAKAAVLMTAWTIASLAPLVAVVMWKAYGGAIHAPELAAVAAGHLLNGALAIGLATCAAAITDHPSTAAMLTLGVTVGGWIINFAAAVNGGIWERLAQYTPTAMIGEFQHGLVRMSVVVVAIALSLTGLAIAAIWMRPGVRVRRRMLECGALAVLATVVVAAGATLRPNWDLSEARLNSFSTSDERMLASLQGPLRMEAHLAPEDPRRSDLERHAVAKLRRTVRDFDITYVSATSTGLFEQTSAGYGEIHYRHGDRQRTSRATTADGVLEEIYALAEVTPEEDEDEVFRGHPLAVAPNGAAAVFYGGWPAAVAGIGLLGRRRGS